MKEAIKKFFEGIDIMRFMTAFTVMFIFFQITNALIYREIPEANKEILIHLLGIVEGAVMTIVGYEFGNSKNSQNKTEDKITEK
jgi:nitrate/nitrite transporter NarK